MSLISRSCNPRKKKNEINRSQPQNPQEEEEKEEEEEEEEEENIYCVVSSLKRTSVAFSQKACI